MTVPDQPAGERISVDAVRDLLALVTAVPRPWLAAVAVAGVLSTVQVSVKPAGTEVTVQMSWITVLLVALVWLPPLVRVIALAGGGIKTPAGEASSGGLLDLLRQLAPETRREALPGVIAALGTDPRSDNPELKSARKNLERQLVSMPVDPGQARERLTQLARNYEQIRESMPSGSARTFKMSQLVAEARGLAGAAGLQPTYLTGIYTGPGDGDRIVTLAAIQAVPDQQTFPIVLDAIQTSRSPFEQYEALRAAEQLLPSLAPAERAQLKQAILERRRLDAEGVVIDERDPSRLEAANLLLREIG